MKSLESMINKDQVKEKPAEEKVTTEIPEYLYTDTEVVGYISKQLQTDIYNMSVLNTIPFVGDISILDVGCGRGDLFHHIKNISQVLNVDYTGYELNDLLVQIGNELFDENDTAKIIHEDFLNIDTSIKYDYTFIIGSLNINYGWDDEDWVYLEKILKKAIEVTNNSITLILIHDSGGNEQYISYPIPNLTDLILQFNYPFTIDYGSISGIYKVTIQTNSIFITE